MGKTVACTLCSQCPGKGPFDFEYSFTELPSGHSSHAQQCWVQKVLLAMQFMCLLGLQEYPFTEQAVRVPACHLTYANQEGTNLGCHILVSIKVDSELV